MEALEGQTQEQRTANQQVGKRPKDHRCPRHLLTDSSRSPWEPGAAGVPGRGRPEASWPAQHKGHVTDSEARCGPRCHIPCPFRETTAQEPQGDQMVQEGASRLGRWGEGVCVTGAHS